MDRYSKAVFTLIAIALWANLFATLVPGRALIRDANAQAPAQPTPVYLTYGPASAAPVVLPVNVLQIGSKSLLQGAMMPVIDTTMMAAMAAQARAATPPSGGSSGTAPPPPPSGGSSGSPPPPPPAYRPPGS
jgi:hypothetical protein